MLNGRHADNQTRKKGGNDVSQIYTLEDIREKLGISVRTLREYAKSGKLKAKKIGRQYFVSESNLTAFVEPEG